jgi:hypothetical protein
MRRQCNCRHCTEAGVQKAPKQLVNSSQTAVRCRLRTWQGQG